MLLYVDSQYASPYAMSVFVALHEKGMAFDIRTVDLAKGQHTEAAFAKTSLTRRIPTLVDGEFALSESSAITEYLDEIHPERPLYPQAVREKARARQLQAWLRSDLMPIRQERPTEVIFYRPVSRPLSAAGVAASKKLFDAAGELLEHGGDHLFGQWSIADTDLALMLNRLVLNGDEVPAPLKRYAQAQWDRPSVQRWVNHERPPL